MVFVVFWLDDVSVIFWAVVFVFKRDCRFSPPGMLERVWFVGLKLVCGRKRKDNNRKPVNWLYKIEMRLNPRGDGTGKSR
jgi:hypothetical protein